MPFDCVTMPALSPSAPAASAPTSAVGWLRAEPGRRESLWFGIVLGLLMIAPVLAARYPQMVDYPAHLARYHVMLDRAQSPFLQQYYGFGWVWSGNLGADLLIWPLAALFPLEVAGRVLAGLTTLVLALGIVATEWTLRRRIGIGTVLGMALVWSPSLQLGFLNFSLSLAGALLAFSAWIALQDRRWRAPLFVAIAPLVWLCHVSGWGILGILVFGFEWHRRKSWRAVLATWPLWLPFAFFLLGSAQASLTSYGANAMLYKIAVWEQAMRGTVKWLDYVSAALIGVTLAGSLVCKRIDGRLGWAMVACLVLAWILPRHVFGGDLVDARMIPTGMLLGCLALTWRAPRFVLIAAALLPLGRLGYTTAEWHRNSADTARALTALDHVPQGARIASAVTTPGWIWGYNTQEHICGYAVVRRDALTNCNFAVPGVHMLSLRQGGARFKDPYHRILQGNRLPIDLSAFAPAAQTDWLWYVGQTPVGTLPFGYAEQARGANWMLARKSQPLAKPLGGS